MAGNIVKYTPLPWSRFYYIYCKGEEYFVDHTAWVVTHDLSIPRMSAEQERRLALILSLNNSGLTTTQIAELFNRLELATPTGTTYTPKLVWVTLKKYRNRLERSLKREWAMSMRFRKICNS